MRKIKIRILNYLLRHLFNAITPDDVMVQMGENLIKNKNKVNQGEIDVLREEAKYILKSRIWEELQNRVKLAANERMYNKSKNFDDMYFGKAILYSADVYEKILKNLSKLK